MSEAAALDVEPSARDLLRQAHDRLRDLRAELVERQRIVSAAQTQREVAEGALEAAELDLEEARLANREMQLAELRGGVVELSPLISLRQKEDAIAAARERIELCGEVVDEARADVRVLQDELTRAERQVKVAVGAVIEASPQMAGYTAALKQHSQALALINMLNRAWFPIREPKVTINDPGEPSRTGAVSELGAFARSRP